MNNKEKLMKNSEKQNKKNRNNQDSDDKKKIKKNEDQGTDLMNKDKMQSQIPSFKRVDQRHFNMYNPQKIMHHHPINFFPAPPSFMGPFQSIPLIHQSKLKLKF